MNMPFWVPVKDGHPMAYAIFRRHYSARRYITKRQCLFVGPGQKIVLLGRNYNALFVWRKFMSMDHQEGVNCAIFRNESSSLSSTLILQAEEYAFRRWPGERLYTYVNPKKIQSNNPGHCFKCAGWRRCGETKRGLIVLEKT